MLNEIIGVKNAHNLQIIGFLIFFRVGEKIKLELETRGYNGI